MVQAVAVGPPDGHSRRVLCQDHPDSKPKPVHCGLGIGGHRGGRNRSGGADGMANIGRWKSRGNAYASICAAVGRTASPPVFRTHWMPREFIYISADWASDR